jgi:putative intracellular protease/amidase
VPLNIGVVVFDGAEELDFVGPWEVFTGSALVAEQAGREPDQVRLVAESLEWLVGQLHGVEHARATRRYIQYDPAPPYMADV